MNQKQIILNRLKKGSVNSYELTYQLSIKQAPTRIHELKKMGYNIDSIFKANGSVDYILLDDVKNLLSINDQKKVKNNTIKDTKKDLKYNKDINNNNNYRWEFKGNTAYKVFY